MATKLNAISIFFPLYNEEENVSKLVETSVKVFSDIANTYEIILVNDGSTDRTEEIANAMSAKYKEVRVISQENQGYGGALKTGFANCKYEWIFFSDGDLQFDFSEIKKFIPFTSDFDLIIGFRKNRAEGFKRHQIARALKIWNKVFLRFPLRIKDIDCAFKLIKKKVIEDISPINADGAMVSTEFLLKAIKKGYKIKQIGVSHYEREFGEPSGNNRKVILKAVKETFMLRKLLKSK